MSPKRLPILTVDIAIANAILEPIVAKNIYKKKRKAPQNKTKNPLHTCFKKYSQFPKE